MIRIMEPTEASQVFELMSKVYADHSFLEQGVKNYQKQVEDGDYVSLGAFDEDGNLQAHAGYKVHSDFALISALAVDPDIRGNGLGREIFNARLKNVRNSGTFKFIAGYSMMQHLGSQKLYPDSFRPIGLDIGYPNIYHGNDAQFNRGDESNAEIVLCERVPSKEYSISLPLAPKDQAIARHIFDSLGVACNFDSVEGGSEVFLGFHPDVKQGLFVPAHLSQDSVVNFDPLLTSNQERETFTGLIKENYERSASR